MMISFLGQPVALGSNSNTQIPNTLATQGMQNPGTVFGQPIQPSKFGIMAATPALNQLSTSGTSQTTSLNNQPSIFSGMQAPTGGILPTGVTASQQPLFQFANSPLPADTSSNTVGGLDLKNLELLLQASNQVEQPALANPTVMPQSAEIPTGRPHVVLTAEAIEALQQQDQPQEVTPKNVKALQAQAKELEVKLEQLEQDKSNTNTQTAFASGVSPEALQTKIVDLKKQINEFESQKNVTATTALKTQIDALENQLKELKATSSTVAQAPPPETPKKANIPPV